MPPVRPYSALLLLVMLTMAAGTARAQQADTAHMATLTGLVRDSTGAPIPHVEVILPALDRGTFSDDAGWFTLAVVPPGQYEVRFERLGYQRVTTRWRAEAGARTEVAVMLQVRAHTLAPVEVTGKAPPCARGASVVLGSVVDSAGTPLPGVLLTLVGTGERATTGADGRFLFLELAPGSYLLRARRLGFAPVTVPVQVVKEARQRMAVRMSALGVLLDTVRVRAASGFGKNASAWRDFDARLQWQRGSHRSTTISSKDLRALGKASLSTAIQYSPAAVRLGVVSGLPGAPSTIATQFKPGGVGPSTAITAPGSSCILVNGSHPVYEPLDAFHADELQAVEIYAPANDLVPGQPESDPTGTIASRMSTIPACGRLGNHPPYFVVWLKGAK